MSRALSWQPYCEHSIVQSNRTFQPKTVHKKNKQEQATREEEIYLKIMMTGYKRSNRRTTKKVKTHTQTHSRAHMHGGDTFQIECCVLRVFPNGDGKLPVQTLLAETTRLKPARIRRRPPPNVDGEESSERHHARGRNVQRNHKRIDPSMYVESIFKSGFDCIQRSRWSFLNSGYNYTYTHTHTHKCTLGDLESKSASL